MDSVLSESLIEVLAPPSDDYSNSETASCLVKPSSYCLFTARLSKRYDQQAPAAISHQAKFRVAVLSIYALYQFINGIEHLDLDVDSHDEEQTETTEEANDPSRYYKNEGASADNNSYQCRDCRQEVSVTLDVEITCPLCQGCWIQECGGVSFPLPSVGSHADTGDNFSGHVGPSDSSLEQGLRPLGIDANTGSDRSHHATGVTASYWIFSATGLGFEAMSAFVDQVSSPQKPHYAFYGMLLSVVAVLFCILDLILSAIKHTEVASWSDMLWGILPEVFGLALACVQCISSALQFSFICRHAANPVKVSLVPFLFFFVLFAFKYRNGRR